MATKRRAVGAAVAARKSSRSAAGRDELRLVLAALKRLEREVAALRLDVALLGARETADGAVTPAQRAARIQRLDYLGPAADISPEEMEAVRKEWRG
jgi:hypothetical protein